MSSESRAGHAARSAEMLVRGFAHELATPLSIIRGRAQLMLDRYPTPSELGEAVTSIDRQVDRISSIMSAALEFVQRRPPEPQTVELGELIASALGAQQSMAIERGVALELERPGDELHVRADPEQLTRVVHNLCDNAIRFSPRDGKVHVTIEQRDALAWLRVTDCGAGMPPEVEEHAFEPFFSRRPGGGMGLGLAYVEAVVVEHGGSVEVETAPGAGTTVSVRLPAWQPRR